MTALRRPSLRLLGDPRLLDAAGAAVKVPKQVFPLALHLLRRAAGPQAQRREIAAALWPDAAGAATNLRQLIARARDAGLDGILFTFGSGSVRLLTEAIDCDLVLLDQLLTGSGLRDAEHCLDLYGNGLLGGSYDRTAAAGDWIAHEDTLLRTRLGAAVAAVLEGPEARGNPTASLAIAGRILAIDPACEAAWCAALRIHALHGRPAKVAAVFAEHVERLARELTAPPSPVVRALYEQLVDGRVPAAARRDAGLRPTASDGRPAVAAPRLVVLPPFDRATEATAPEAVAATLVEDVVARLCSLSSLRIVAHHTAWRLRHDGFDEALADRFAIDYVAETTLTARGGEQRLSVRLFERVGRSILWADSYTFDASTSETCFRSIVGGIVQAVADAVERFEAVRVTAAEPGAYYWYLVGQRSLRHTDLPETRRAAAAFRRALRLDPEFPPALSGLARSGQREWLLLGQGETALLDAALAHGRDAVRLDDRDSRGLRVLGLCSLYRRRFDESISHYEQAERLSPQHADTLADFADALAHSGEPEAGLRKMLRAIELNPIPPDQYWWDLGGIQCQLGRYRDALRSVSRMERPIARMRLAAACWAMLGDTTRARQCAAEFLESYPDFRIDSWLAMVPDRNPEDQRHYEAALRAAGFS